MKTKLILIAITCLSLLSFTIKSTNDKMKLKAAQEKKANPEVSTGGFIMEDRDQWK